LHLSVQVLSCTGDRPSQYCSMTSKDMGYPGRMVFEVKQTCTRHPFLKVGNDLLLGRNIKISKMLNHLAQSISKQSRFYIIPLSGQRIQLIIIPEYSQDLILLID